MATTYTIPGGLSLNERKALAALLACQPCCSSGSGSGSGSGGGSGDGGIIACGCDWAGLALASLTCTVQFPCASTSVTFSLTPASSSGDQCLLWQGTGTTVAKSAGSTTDCNTGLPVSSALIPKLTAFIDLRCFKCSGNTDCHASTIWLLGISLTAVNSGIYYSGFTTPLPCQASMSLLSCSPVLFATKTITFVCAPATAPDTRLFYNCCGAGPGDIYLSHAGQCTDYGVTNYASSVGCTAIIDISV